LPQDADNQPAPPLKAVIVPVTPFQQNCTIFWCEATKRGAVVDPGGELPRIRDAVAQVGITVEKILLTHAHVDHAAGAGELAELLGVVIEGPHRDDLFLIESLPAQAARYAFPPARVFEPARWLEQGDTVTVGELTLEVRHCPGHSPGSVVFFHPESRLAISGDVLFQGSVGRTDLPRGDFDTLAKSIREQMWPLGDDVAFIPGHGPMSTIGDERRTNPFVGERATARP